MKLKPDTFAIDHSDGTTKYVEARNFRITWQGVLVFYSWPWQREAAFAHGTWNGGTVRGVGPEEGQEAT